MLYHTDPGLPKDIRGLLMTYNHRHNASYDYARLLAVVGIIWFHTGAPAGRIGYSGLAFFLLLLVVLALPQIMAARPQAHRAPMVLRYAATRGRRLLLPWLIASAFYGGLKLVEVSQGTPFASEFTLSTWLTGPALHLWFLPFAFAISLALWPLGRALQPLAVHQRALWIAGLVLLALASLSLSQPGPLLIPLAQWTYALPIVLLGCALALLRDRPLAMLALLALFIGSASAAGLIWGLPEITLAGLLLVLCTALPLRASALSALAARSTLTLYLIHPAVMALSLRADLAPEGSTALALTVTALSLMIVAFWETIAAPRLPTPQLFS